MASPTTINEKLHVFFHEVSQTGSKRDPFDSQHSDVQFSSFQISKFQFQNFQVLKLSISKFLIFKFENFQKAKVIFSSFPILKFSKFQIPKVQQVRYTDLPTFSEFQILRYENNICQGCSQMFSCTFKYFGDKYGARGSRFSRFFWEFQK